VPGFQPTSNYYRSSDGTNWVLQITEFPRYGHGSLVFGGAIFVIAGYGGSSTILSSLDGLSWTVANPSVEFGGRNPASSVSIFQGKQWISGGWSGSALKDCWWSANGTTWYRATSDTGFHPRYYHEMISFRKYLWVIGGYCPLISSRVLNDVWHSGDGTNWNISSANAPFAARYAHAAIVSENVLFVLGGCNTNTYFSDIWASKDGTNWNLVTEAAPWGQRAYMRTAIWRNKVWLVGGSVNGLFKNDVWYSD
jgi:hypothetical protein